MYAREEYKTRSAKAITRVLCAQLHSATRRVADIQRHHTNIITLHTHTQIHCAISLDYRDILVYRGCIWMMQCAINCDIIVYCYYYDRSHHIIYEYM